VSVYNETFQFKFDKKAKLLYLCVLTFRYSYLIVFK